MANDESSWRQRIQRYLSAGRGGGNLRTAKTENPSIPPLETKEPAEGESLPSSETPAEGKNQYIPLESLQNTASAHSAINEYTEFLDCMRRGERKFQKRGFTVQDEFNAWQKDRRKRLAHARPAEEEAVSTRPA